VKYTLLTRCLLASLWLSSCQPTEKKNKESPSQTAAQASKGDSIVRDTVTNRQGVKLAMAYNNAARTATFVLKGEVIQLKQDTVASGIKYSNANYEYSEHQGVIILRKGGNVIFRNQQ